MPTLKDKNAPYYEARRLIDEGRNDEAFELYVQLASDGDPNCQVFVGWMLVEGIGVTSNPPEGFEWFKRAANMGSARGAYACANYLLVQKRDAEAIPYLRRAANAAFGPATLWLGICHFTGRGVAKNSQKGISLMEEAAQQGNWIAKRKLATLKIRGHYGWPGIIAGVVVLPILIISALFTLMVDGYSENFMG